MTLIEAVHYRRSVRNYKSESLDKEKVKKCLELATLAPNSSNMQLWEFYHITNPEKLKELAKLCLNQQAATTAQQMVVFVTRQDLHVKRAKKMLELETLNITKNSASDKQTKRINRWKLYYGKVMPFLYSRCFGVLGWFRKIMVNIIGVFRPIFHQV